MNEYENLAMENIDENVDVTTEEITAQDGQEEPSEQIETPARTYTEEEVNQIVGKRLARNNAKIRKEYEQKYGALENVLKAGTGKENVEDMTETFRKYYEGRGVRIPSEPAYSERDIAVLAKAEAEEIIGLGIEEVIEEVDRLTGKGLGNMTAREKEVFKALAQHRQEAERNNALTKLGVKEEVYNSKEFRDFSAKFSSSTPVTEIYEIYNKMQPKKEVEPMGSMKNSNSGDTGVKDFYTRDEALKFTRADFDKNPALFKAVEKSMRKW